MSGRQRTEPPPDPSCLPRNRHRVASTARRRRRRILPPLGRSHDVGHSSNRSVGHAIIIRQVANRRWTWRGRQWRRRRHHRARRPTARQRRQRRRILAGPLPKRRSQRRQQRQHACVEGGRRRWRCRKCRWVLRTRCLHARRRVENGCSAGPRSGMRPVKSGRLANERAASGSIRPGPAAPTGATEPPPTSRRHHRQTPTWAPTDTASTRDPGGARRRRAA